MPMLRMATYPCRLAPGVTRAGMAPRGPFLLDRVVAVVDGNDAEGLSAGAARAATRLDVVLSTEAGEALRMPLSSGLCVRYEQALDDDDEPVVQADGSPELIRIHGLRLLDRVLFAGDVDLRIEGAVPAEWDVTILLRGTERTD